MPVGMFVKLTVDEGRNDEFEALYSELAGLVNENETGCNYYQVHKSRNDPQIYVVMEEYADQAALDAHAQTDYSKAFGEKLLSFTTVTEVEVLDRI